MVHIGLVGLGDMGAAVGRSLVSAGHDVSTVLSGRSEASLKRAREAGIKDAGSIEVLMDEVAVILSIVPPGEALGVVRDFADAMEDIVPGFDFLDLNAVAPQSVEVMADEFRYVGGSFCDGGIIGAPPFKTGNRTRIYLSGPLAQKFSFLATDEIDVRVCGEAIGQASGLKMAYAALTKGTMTLQTAVLLAARQMELMGPLTKELEESQSDKLKAMRSSVPFIAADSVRWADEMDEIAKCFADVGVTDGFHHGAGDIFRLLASTPLEAETRATADYSRTLEEAIDVYAASIKKS